jgi:hypothetical protein
VRKRKDMKKRILKDIDEFQHLCYMAMKISAGDFAKENFPKLVENFWDDNKSDTENLNEIKKMFETNKTLNETMGNPDAAQVIAAFQEGWLSKL